MPATAFQFAWRGWILGALFLFLGWSRLGSERHLAPAWLLLIGVGAVYRLNAGRFIGGHSNGLTMDGVALANSGPYGLNRHPLYLANILTAAGLLLFANCLPLWGEGLILSLVIGHHDRLAREEEGFLTAAHGDAYRRYMDVTPRWFGFSGMEFRRGAKGRENTSASNVSSAAPTRWGLGFRRQRGNLGKTLAAVLALWALAWFPK